MDHHVEAFSVDMLLARMVKMELRELVLMIADRDKAPRRIGSPSRCDRYRQFLAA